MKFKEEQMTILCAVALLVAVGMVLAIEFFKKLFKI